MKPLSVLNLAIAFVIFALVGALTLAIFPTLMFTPFTGLMFLGIAAVLFYFGRKVVALRKGESRKLSATGAMNVAMFAYSSAWVSAGSLGFFIGSALSMLRNLHSTYVRISIAGALLSAVGALILLIIAVIVERWCQIDDDDESGPSNGLEEAT
ncbi:MAG: DUF3180 domain-containing protein [Actinomycetaceae bacterium]|nr:DUF3180 domain-containing protein [Actinomycetaceae bacterium]